MRHSENGKDSGPGVCVCNGGSWSKMVRAVVTDHYEEDTTQG